MCSLNYPDTEWKWEKSFGKKHSSIINSDLMHWLQLWRKDVWSLFPGEGGCNSPLCSHRSSRNCVYFFVASGIDKTNLFPLIQVREYLHKTVWFLQKQDLGNSTSLILWKQFASNYPCLYEQQFFVWVPPGTWAGCRWNKRETFSRNTHAQPQWEKKISL